MNNITWLYGKKLENLDILLSLEKKYNFSFPSEYKDIVLLNDGATPIPQNFTVAGKEKVFNYLAKVADIETIFANICREYNSKQILVPFADDPAGNLICFDYTEDKTIPHVTFLNTDDGEIIEIAKTFNDFLQILV
ncbi:MAG: SMI1/KNR4 family protein [Lentisphaeria bacterium]|nr:SMI1/KNR4 family protein [Lentisphaeria bacterium]